MGWMDWQDWLTKFGGGEERNATGCGENLDGS